MAANLMTRRQRLVRALVLGAPSNTVYSKRLMQANDENAKDFAYILAAFRHDLEPVGILEETLVEKIADEYRTREVFLFHYGRFPSVQWQARDRQIG